jgi:S-formylglutathione hydrolase FrmB
MALVLHLPDAQRREAGRRYPVLYLLHGSGHDRWSVLREVQPQACIAELGQALLVIPDGEQGWWMDSPVVSHSRYGELFLELVSLVDHSYPTIAERGARGLCGFSMGGYGAMLLASQHPDLFGAASSLLGPLDIPQLFPDYHRLRLLLGRELGTWQQYNPCQHAANLRDTALWFCTGESSFDRPQNDAFASALQAQQIHFTYQVHSGGHDTSFVHEHMRACFAFHGRQFDAGK